MQFQPNTGHPEVFQTPFVRTKSFRSGGRCLQGLDLSSQVSYLLGPQVSSAATGNVLGAESFIYMLSKIMFGQIRLPRCSWYVEFIPCVAHLSPPLPSWRNGKGTVGGKRKWKAEEGGTQTREEAVWGTSSQPG